MKTVYYGGLILLLVQVAGALGLWHLWQDAYGPQPTTEAAAVVPRAMWWMGAYGLASVAAASVTTFGLLRRAHPAIAALGILLVTLPASVSGVVALYFLGACLGLV